MDIWKPWYIYRPQQILLRLFRSFTLKNVRIKEIKLPWGMNIAIDTDTIIGKNIWQTGIFDIAVSEVIHRLINQGDLVLDIGANIGYMTALMGKCVGNTGNIYSFEPHPTIFETLSQNVEGFSKHSTFGNTKLFTVALSDQEGISNLVCPENFSENNGLAYLDNSCRENAENTIPVTTQRLDSILGDKVARVTKIDVEGHELSVLHGASLAIREKRLPHIVYEDHIGAGSKVSNFLCSCGYTLFQIGWCIDRPLLVPLDKPSISKSYEAPSYLATLLPDEALAKCESKGWRVLCSP